MLDLVLEAGDNNEGDNGTGEDSETLQGSRQIRFEQIIKFEIRQMSSESVLVSRSQYGVAHLY